MADDPGIEEIRYGVLTFMLWHDRRDYKLFAQLAERQLGHLYLTLAQEFPPKDDPKISGFHQVEFREDMGRWRESVLSHLAQRGTWAAADELIRLAGELPEVEWLPIRVAQARELARSATWTPLTPEDLMEIVRSPDKRVVESEIQLQEVLLESLARLQKELQAETPAAAYYWNHPNDSEANPKDEKEISNYIKRHLDQDLGHSGILINREVENHPKNITDIYVQASRTDAQARADVITVVCEVKGCWNRELYTAQEEQLLNRYLIENGHTHGIYIVAFFDGDRWSKKDRASRHRNCKRHTVAELRDELMVQSQTLSGDGKVLRSVVLDMNF